MACMLLTIEVISLVIALHESTLSQPRVKSFFFCPEKKKIVGNKISEYQEKI